MKLEAIWNDVLKYNNKYHAEKQKPKFSFKKKSNKVLKKALSKQNLESNNPYEIMDYYKPILPQVERGNKKIVMQRASDDHQQMRQKKKNKFCFTSRGERIFQQIECHMILH